MHWLDLIPIGLIALGIAASKSEEVRHRVGEFIKETLRNRLP